MENLVTIGRFAEAAQVSQKALRLYAANGLLPPARVDGDTGYRYYGVEQLHTARLIGLLRSAGMSLLEIRRLLASRSTEASTCTRSASSRSSSSVARFSNTSDASWRRSRCSR
jgi:protein phosphatase